MEAETMQQIAQPTNLITLQWVIIVALASVVMILFKQWVDANKRNEKLIASLLERTLDGLHENTEAINGLASMIEEWQRSNNILQAIERLQQGQGDDRKKD